VNESSAIIIGAGPAGLTAAYRLAQHEKEVLVLEADETYVGGISRTVRYKGYSFDIGGHRFFSKSKAVEDFWSEILGDELLLRPRSSRIYYRGKFFSYPLRPWDALQKLGPVEALRCVLSYVAAQVFPVKEPAHFRDWVRNRFGERLFEIFFRTYTEKVWGMKCEEISVDWAAQRINSLSLGRAIWNALRLNGGSRDRGRTVKSLIESFRYPRLGPGMMWEACAEKLRGLGGEVRMGRRVARCDWDESQGLWEVTHVSASGEQSQSKSRHLVSSAPIRALATFLSPALSAKAQEAARALRYRDFLTVVLIYRDADVFQDNWIYVHEPGVKVGRVQNFKSWSPEMVPDPSTSSYGLEYFCFEGDGLWSASDEDLIELGKREMAKLGLARDSAFIDGTVVRQPKAYPVYDADYTRHLATIRTELEQRFPTLHLVGRNGMHKYNNQDHSMMTAMLCAENILAGKNLYDLWQVNQDAEYHETQAEETNSPGASGLRMAPLPVAPGLSGR
jgi:protoporphyrinogen oxidase